MTCSRARVQVQGGLITTLHIPPPPPQAARQLDTRLWNTRLRVELSSFASLSIEYVPLQTDTTVKQSPSHPALSANQTQQVQVWNKCTSVAEGTDLWISHSFWDVYEHLKTIVLKWYEFYDGQCGYIDSSLAAGILLKIEKDSNVTFYSKCSNIRLCSIHKHVNTGEMKCRLK